MYNFLIIDDDEEILENIKEIFELTGHKVLTATNGWEGIKLASQFSPDLILCDVTMPGIDGYEVKSKLNLTKSTSLIPFIYLTAKSDLNHIRTGMNLGADDYIVKPVHAKELIEITYKRLERIKEFKNLDSKVKPERKLSIDEKILLSTEKEHILVPVRNLVAIAVTGDYTKVYLNDGKKTIVKKALKAWEKKLPDDIFVRAHRNLIINLHHIEKLESWFNGTFSARINNYPKVVLFSKRYSQKFKKKLKNLFLSD